MYNMTGINLHLKLLIHQGAQMKNSDVGRDGGGKGKMGVKPSFRGVEMDN